MSQKKRTFAPAFKIKHNGDPLAQLVEHNTFNVGVLGSSPKRITKRQKLLLLSLFLFKHPQEEGKPRQTNQNRHRVWRQRSSGDTERFFMYFSQA